MWVKIGNLTYGQQRTTANPREPNITAQSQAIVPCQFSLTLSLSQRERRLPSPFGGRVGDEGENGRKAMSRTLKTLTLRCNTNSHTKTQSLQWRGINASARIIEKMPYLIDGHNLIPKLGLRLDSPDDEMELVAILQEFSRLSRHTVEVYFDGAPAGQSGMRKFGVVITHFVRLGTTADSAIKARLQQMGRAARNWVVVSSDHEVRDAARAAHVSVTSSDRFAGLLKGTRPSASGSSRESEMSQEELEGWLKLFGRKE